MKTFESKQELKEFLLNNTPILIKPTRKSKYKYISPFISQNAMSEVVNRITDELWDSDKIKDCIMKKPFRCPICLGNGLVPNGFYNQVGGQWSTTSLTPETCKSCSGTGIVWNEESNESDKKKES